jgi:hypothetical protein
LCGNEQAFGLIFEGLHPERVAVDMVQLHNGSVASTGDVKEVTCLIGIDGCRQAVLLVQFIDVHKYIVLFLNAGVGANVNWLFWAS